MWSTASKAAATVNLQLLVQVISIHPPYWYGPWVGPETHDRPNNLYSENPCVPLI